MVANTPTSIGNVIIQISVDGSKQALRDINIFGKGAVAGIAKISAGYNQIRGAITGVLSDIQPLYQALIASNGQLNASILKSQTAIAQNFNVYDEFGNKITDVRDKILSTEGVVREAILNLEAETRELTGITSATTVEAFNIVLSEAGGILSNQLGDFATETDAAVKLTKGLLASIGTLGLDIGQVRQEFRALIRGDLKNPDAAIIQALGLDENAFRQASQEGRLSEFLAEQFAVFEEANALASDSIAGVTSNIQDIFEIGSRALGEGLSKSIGENLKEFQDLLFENEDQIIAVATELGRSLEQIFSGVIDIARSLLPLIRNFSGLEQVARGVFDAIRLAGEGFSNISRLLEQDLRGQLLESDSLFGQVARTIDGLAGFFGNLQDSIKQAISDFTGLPLETIDNLLNKIAKNPIGTSLEGLRGSFAILNGNLADSQAALEAQGGALDTLTAEVDRYGAALTEAENAGNTERAEQLRQVIRGIGEEIAAQQAQIAETKTYNPVDEAELERQEQSVADLLSRVSELGVAIDGTTFGAKDLPVFGETVEELTRTLDGSLKQIEEGAGGSVQAFQQNVDTAREYISLLREIGGISAEDAVAKLTEIANAEETRPEQRLEIERQITSIVQDAASERVGIYEKTQTQIQTALARGQITAGEAATQQLEAERQRVADQLADLQRELEVLEGSGTNQRRIRELRTEIENLNASLEGTDAQITASRLDEQITQAERAAQLASTNAERAQAERLQNIRLGNAAALNLQAEFQAELIKSEQEASDAQLQILRDRLAATESAIESAVGDRRRDLEQELIGLETQLIQTETQSAQLSAQLTQATISAVEERLQIQNQATEEQLLREEIAFQQRVNNLELTEGEITQATAEEAAERAQIARDEAAARLAALQSIEAPQDAQARLQLEAQIRDARLQALEAEANLLRTNGQLDRVLRQRQISALDRQIERAQQLQDIEEARFDFASRRASFELQDAQRQAEIADNQLALTQAQFAIAQQQIELRLQELDTASALNQELRENENLGTREARLIRQRLNDLGLLGRSEISIARQRLQALREQQEVEQDALQARQEGEQRALELRRLQQTAAAELAVSEERQALRREQQALKELELERLRAELIEDPAERARVLQNIDERIGLQEEGIGIQRQAVDQANRNLDAVNQQLDLEQQVLDIQQQQERQQQEAQQAEAEFQAERRLARAQDAQQLARQANNRDGQDRERRRRLTGQAIAGSGVEQIALAAQQRTAPNITNNVTNNFNSPLSNASTARALGV